MSFSFDDVKDITKRVSVQALLIWVEFSFPNFNKKSIRARNIVSKEMDTEAGLINTVIKVIPPHATESLRRAVGTFQRYYVSVTLPFRERTWRIISAKAYPEFERKYNEATAVIESEWSYFIQELPIILSNAKEYLGENAHLAAGIDPVKLEKKFSRLTLTTNPCPMHSHYILEGMGEGLAEALERDLERQMRAAMRAASADVWKRIYEAISQVAKLANGDHAHYTGLSKILELADVLPMLNLAGDPNLDAMHSMLELEIKPLIKGDPKEFAKHVRNDTYTANELAEKTREIQRRMAGLITVTQPGEGDNLKESEIKVEVNY